MENIPGAQTLDKILYPPPILKKYSGSFVAGKEVENRYKKKVGGTWQTAGTSSTIKNRTFRDNPFAINGERASVLV